MPVKPIKMKDELDRFYTKEVVAKQCIDTLLQFCDDSDLFVEPSAGSGAFFNQLPTNKIGIDLSPAASGVFRQDWLKFYVPKGCVVVGNPPFGSRNSLSKAFIKHALSGAKIIAFVLPASYKKETMQKVFPDDWELVSVTDLPDNSFLLDREDYHVPCVFQVWRKVNGESTQNLRESCKVKKATEDFCFTSKEGADYFIFGASPSKILEKYLVKPSNRGYYIKQKAAQTLDLLQ